MSVKRLIATLGIITAVLIAATPSFASRKWKLIENPYFSFLLPPQFTKLDTRGIDSFVERYTDGRMTIEFDYGSWSNNFNSWDDSTKFELLKIDGRDAKIGTAEQSFGRKNTFSTQVYFASVYPGKDGPRLSMFASCADKTDIETAHQIFKRIRFGNSKPRESLQAAVVVPPPLSSGALEGGRVSFLKERFSSDSWQVRYGLLDDLSHRTAQDKELLLQLIYDKNASVATQALSRYLNDFALVDSERVRPKLSGLIPLGKGEGDSDLLSIQFYISKLDATNINNPRNDLGIRHIGLVGKRADEGNLLPFQKSDNPYVLYETAKALISCS